MAQDLGSYLALLERQMPDELVRIKRELSPVYEITALTADLERRGRFPALLCERVGAGRPPVLTNLHASRRRLALALGTTEAALVAEYGRRAAAPVAPVTVGAAPVQEVVLRGGDADCRSLPLLTHFESDAGPYITAGILAVRDPDTGARNLSYGRLMLAGPHELRTHMAPGRHLSTILARSEARGRPLEAAVIVGVHPAIALGSLSGAPPDADEYAVVGGILGEALELVRGVTVDVEVPAQAELVIEGRFLPGVRRSEGPFGEFTGYSVPAGERPVLEVTAITHRRQFVYLDIAPGLTDHRLMGAVPKEARLLASIKGLVPTVRAVHFPPSGCGRFHAYVAIEKRTDGQPKSAIVAALGAELFLKLVVVVDHDVDVFDEPDVLAAVANWTQADRSLVTVSGAQGSDLDPSSGPAGLAAKLGIDATRPLTGAPPKLVVPRDVAARIRAEDYVP